MRALGKKGLPEAFSLGPTRFHLEREIKHDFFAATGFYLDDCGRRVVLKMSRTEEFAGLPLEWVGRWLCRRETRFYEALSDLPSVPSVLGRVGTTGFVHEFVPGRPLSRNRPVPDGFFAELSHLLDELHRRNIAYVDTNKPENILLGDDGKPHLIDFQISWDLRDFGDWWLTRAILRRLQGEDRYHTLKHKSRLRPDELTPEEKERVGRTSPWIRLHRLITRPYFKFRRRTFARLRGAGRLAEEGSN
jgi:hypothetical protein